MAADDSAVDRAGLRGTRSLMKSGRFKIRRGSDDEEVETGDGLPDSVSQDGSTTRLDHEVQSGLSKMNSVFVQLQSEVGQVVAGGSASSTAPAPNSRHREAVMQPVVSNHSSPASASLTTPVRPSSASMSQSNMGSLSFIGNEALGQWQSLGRKIEKATKLNRMLEQRNRMLKEEKRRKQLELDSYIAELEIARAAALQNPQDLPRAAEAAQQQGQGRPQNLGSGAAQLGQAQPPSPLQPPASSNSSGSRQPEKLEEFVNAFNQVAQSKDKDKLNQPVQQQEPQHQPQNQQSQQPQNQQPQSQQPQSQQPQSQQPQSQQPQSQQPQSQQPQSQQPQSQQPQSQQPQSQQPQSQQPQSQQPQSQQPQSQQPQSQQPQNQQPQNQQPQNQQPQGQQPQSQQPQSQQPQNQQQQNQQQQKATWQQQPQPPKGPQSLQQRGTQDFMQEEAQNAFNQMLLQQQQQHNHLQAGPQPASSNSLRPHPHLGELLPQHPAPHLERHDSPMRITRQSSLPQLFGHRERAEIEGISPDTEGYGQPNTYREWRRYAANRSSEKVTG